MSITHKHITYVGDLIADRGEWIELLLTRDCGEAKWGDHVHLRLRFCVIA